MPTIRTNLVDAYLFRRVEGSPRRFRHEVYARIAEGEPDAWATCGTQPQRDKATKPPGNGSRVHKDVTSSWDRAFAVAFDGMVFEKRNGTFAEGMNGWTIIDLAEVDLDAPVHDE